jgi:hypothetical protein
MARLYSEQALFGGAPIPSLMVRTWVSGGQNSEVLDKLRQEIADLETKRDKLVDSNKSKLFQWALHVLKTGNIPEGNLTREVKETMLEYETITQTLFDREVLLSERLDEQAKFDSLG